MVKVWSTGLLLSPGRLAWGGEAEAGSSFPQGMAQVFSNANSPSHSVTPGWAEEEFPRKKEEPLRKGWVGVRD